MDRDIAEVLFTKEQLEQRVAELGAEITRDYADKENVVLVGILRGSYMFLADLSRHIDTPCRIDFMAASSYGKGTSSSGQIEIKKDLTDPINGAHVILVEDILDSGNTLDYLAKILTARNPASIRIATLLDKPERRTKNITADYAGFTVPDAFVVGYGLDYAEEYRNLPYIGILKPEVYEKA
jgi:hypoxanthine phosphoribosyltransferase